MTKNDIFNTFGGSPKQVGKFNSMHLFTLITVFTVCLLAI